MFDDHGPTTGVILADVKGRLQSVLITEVVKVDQGLDACDPDSSGDLVPCERGKSFPFDGGVLFLIPVRCIWEDLEFRGFLQGEGATKL